MWIKVNFKKMGYGVDLEMSEDLPLKLRIMIALGMAKVTKQKRKEVFDDSKFSRGTLPKGFSDPYTFTRPRRTRRRRIRFPTGFIVPLGILIPMIFAFLPLIDQADTDVKVDNADTIREKAKIVAEKEGKNDWEKNTWDNPDVPIQLNQLKAEIDNADCKRLGEMFQNERWTLRAYVAHTILEEGC